MNVCEHQKEGYSINAVQIQRENRSTFDDLACSVHVCQNLVWWHGHRLIKPVFSQSQYSPGHSTLWKLVVSKKIPIAQPGLVLSYFCDKWISLFMSLKKNFSKIFCTNSLASVATTQKQLELM